MRASLMFSAFTLLGFVLMLPAVAEQSSYVEDERPHGVFHGRNRKNVADTLKKRVARLEALDSKNEPQKGN